MIKVLHGVLAASVLLVGIAGAAAGQQAVICPSPVPFGQNETAGHRVRVNGIAMYYETYGSGPPLLLLHGNGGSIYSMRCQIAYFSSRHRIIVPDHRAHGRTEDGAGPLTYEQMADDVAALLDKIEANPVQIIGQSDGGIMALLLAIRHPDKVSKLVVSAPNLRSDTTALAPWVFPRFDEAIRQADSMLATGDRSQNWARVKRQQALMRNEPRIPPSKLRKVRAPTLIMAGDEDVVRPEHLLEIYRNLPKAHLFIMPGATHFSFGKSTNGTTAQPSDS